MNTACKPATRPGLTLSFLAALLMLLPLIANNLFAQENPTRLDVTAADQTAATYNASHFQYHLLASDTAAGVTALAARNLGTKVSSRAIATAGTIAAVPSPGFYGEDLVYFGGKVLQTTTSHNIYVNMASCGGTVASCWGNPRQFIEDFSQSKMIHLTDQYVHTTASNRYPAGESMFTTIPLFSDNVVGQNELLGVIHAAAKAEGAGYGRIYHVFLPKGIDTCFDLTNVCYSPDNPPSFVFCAYHGSVDFSDIGHVLLSVEPYQNVSGCAAAPPNPNGMLADSTNAILSHELIESITDPDPFGPGNPNSGWVSFKSLIAAGFEIGDLCQPLGNSKAEFLYPTVLLNGKPYELQGEYSNKYHACAFAP
jgi:hypothetical protein